MSFPDPFTGGSFDFGAVGTLAGGGKGGGIGRVTGDFGVSAGGVSDLAGRGGQVSATLLRGGGFLDLDLCGNIRGGGVRVGRGVNAEAQATGTVTVSYFSSISFGDFFE